MRYRFTRAWARSCIVAGYLLMLAGPIVGFVLTTVPLVDWKVPIRAAAWQVALISTMLGLLTGLLLGGPLVLWGQLILVFLDQRGLLARIDARFRRPGRPGAGDDHARRVADRYLRR